MNRTMTRPFSIAILWFSLGISASHAQLKPGFQPEEAKDMIMLCTTHTFIDLYGSEEKDDTWGAMSTNTH